MCCGCTVLSFYLWLLEPPHRDAFPGTERHRSTTPPEILCNGEEKAIWTTGVEESKLEFLEPMLY